MAASEGGWCPSRPGTVRHPVVRAPTWPTCRSRHFLSHPTDLTACPTVSGEQRRHSDTFLLREVRRTLTFFFFWFFQNSQIFIQNPRKSAPHGRMHESRGRNELCTFWHVCWFAALPLGRCGCTERPRAPLPWPASPKARQTSSPLLPLTPLPSPLEPLESPGKTLTSDETSHFPRNQKRFRPFL